MSTPNREQSLANLALLGAAEAAEHRGNPALAEQLRGSADSILPPGEQGEALAPLSQQEVVTAIVGGALGVLERE